MRMSVGGALLGIIGLLACSDAASEEGAITLDVVEFPFEQNLGPQRSLEWTMYPVTPSLCAAVSADGNLLFVYEGYVAKHGHDALKNPGIWSVRLPSFTEGELTDCPQILPTADGGAFLVAPLGSGGPTAAMRGIVKIANDGSTVWQHVVQGVYYGSAIAVVRSTGDLALVYVAESDKSHTNLVYFDDKGNEAQRHDNVLPSVHYEDADHPGTAVTPEQTPGVGIPGISALSASPDGGVLAVGSYGFFRYIACGTESDPQDTYSGGTACGSGASNGLVARFDSSANLAWATPLGHAYRTSPISLGSVAAMPDGSIAAAGGLIVESQVVFDPHVQALAVRLDGAGQLTWAKSFPFGKAPGVTFLKGTSFDALAPQADGSADLMLHLPKGNACRLVRLDPSGNVSRVQALENVGGGESQLCEARAIGSDIVYTTTDMYGQGAIAKLAN